ncbi:MAG: SLC13 family permease, partial [Chitinophagales bacterium]|nr:SLC13 family permease [Chitinophagales bacterium]
MTFEVVFILTITVLALIAFASDRVAPDVVALLVMVSLMVSGILSPSEGISGFSNPATITILAFFFVSLALEKSGAIRYIGDILLKLSNNNLMVDVLLITSIAGISSAFINTTAVVIVFLPIVLRLGRMKGISPTLLLMPLSFGAIIGGASTTIGTSTNLIISEAATHSGGEALAVFEFTHIGIFLFVILIIYMMFASKYILKARKIEDDLLQDYDLRSYITELTLDKSCPWIGKKISDIPAFRSLNISVLDIERNENEIVLPDLHEVLMEGDRLMIRVNPKNY